MTSAMASRSINKCTVDKYTHHHSICDFKMRNSSDVVGMCKQTTFNKVCLLIYSHIRQHIGVVDPLCLRSDILLNTDPRRRVSRRSRRRYEAHCGPERRATHAHAVFEAVENSSQWRDPANCTMAFFESTNGLTMFSKSWRLFQTIPLLLLTKAEQCTYNMGTPPGVKGGSSPNTTICSSFGDVINQAERDGDGSCTIYFRGGGVAYQEKHRKTSWATTILVG